MEYLRERPYVIVAIVALSLIIIGFLIVRQRTAVSPGDVRVWGGIGGYTPIPNTDTNYQPTVDPGDLYTRVRHSPPFLYTPPEQIPSTESTDELAAFLRSLSKSAGGTAVSASSSLDAYSFIPSGLISVAEPQTTRTPLQDDLYSYGNAVGSTIQSFEDRNRAMPRVLRDQFEDRADSQKRAALLDLAADLAGLGRSLDTIEPVPEIARTAHAKLVASYKEMGEKLAKVPDATTDEEIVAAMLTYNAAAEGYVRNFVALALIFSTADVRFTASEGGSVFTFTQASL